jgi:ribonucleotide monophosphatase NagD (HAD superfamily)
VGWDRQADYEKLCRASLLVQRGAVLFATNADASYPAADGNWPGAGALLAAVETTTGARAEVFGKPEAPIVLAALDEQEAARPRGRRPTGDGHRGAAGLGWIRPRPDRHHPAERSRRVLIVPTFVGDDLSALFAPPAP